MVAASGGLLHPWRTANRIRPSVAPTTVPTLPPCRPLTIPQEAKWIHTKQPQHQITEDTYVLFKVEE